MVRSSHYLNGEIIKKVYPTRNKQSHKYRFGSLLIIGGSKIYSGAPALAALAAYKAGVDLVNIAAPERAANIIASYSPNLITHPLEGDYLNENHLDELLRLAKKSSAVIIGNGLERNEETLQTVNKFLKRINTTCVIDADAIHATAENMRIVQGKEFILTPHAREFYALTNVETWGSNIQKKVEIVTRIALHLKTNILLKGPIDVVSNDEHYILNKTGHVSMTVGGTGDTLAGIIGSLLAQGNLPYDAACAGAYINGKAGEFAAKKLGVSMTAIDLIEKISEVIK